MATTREKLTLQQTASELGRSQTQVRRYIRSGKLRAEKVGPQWLVDRNDLDAFRRKADDVQMDALLRRLAKNRERIRKRIGGNLDVMAMLDEDREGHP